MGRPAGWMKEPALRRSSREIVDGERSSCRASVLAADRRAARTGTSDGAITSQRHADVHARPRLLRRGRLHERPAPGRRACAARSRSWMGERPVRLTPVTRPERDAAS